MLFFFYFALFLSFVCCYFFFKYFYRFFMVKLFVRKTNETFHPTWTHIDDMKELGVFLFAISFDGSFRTFQIICYCYCCWCCCCCVRFFLEIYLFFLYLWNSVIAYVSLVYCWWCACVCACTLFLILSWLAVVVVVVFPLISSISLFHLRWLFVVCAYSCWKITKQNTYHISIHTVTYHRYIYKYVFFFII